MHIEKKKVGLKYEMALKIMYGVILIFFLLIFLILVEKTWNNGRHGEFAALIIGEIFAIYGGVLLNRLWKRDKNKKNINSEKEITDSIEKLGEESRWREYYQSISRSKQKISYMRHDIANHVQVLQAIQEHCNVKLDRMEEVRRELEKLSYIKYCDNVLFDMAIEQRIRAMQNRGLQVQTDIQLIGMENVHSEQLCLVFWLLIDGISDNICKGQNISIKIHRHSSTDSGVILVWSIEAECEKINKDNVKLLEFLLDRMNGSIMVDVSDGKIMETGMMEVKYADGR